MVLVVSKMRGTRSRTNRSRNTVEIEMPTFPRGIALGSIDGGWSTLDYHPSIHPRVEAGACKLAGQGFVRLAPILMKQSRDDWLAGHDQSRYLLGNCLECSCGSFRNIVMITCYNQSHQETLDPTGLNHI